MKHEWLGILVNDGLIEGIKKQQTGHEKIDFYLEAGKKYGFSTCFFSLRDISLKTKRVNAFIYSGGKWKQRKLPIPKVIHNRAIFHSKSNWQRSKKLVNSGVQLFNFWNRYGKLYIGRLLATQPEFTSHLPLTLPFTSQHVKEMTERFSSFLLKPNKGTVGEGIIKLDKADEGAWKASYRLGKRMVQPTLQEDQVYSKLKKIAGTGEYFIQETIPLATYHGSPFDIRVSAQRDGTGEWGITGLMGKVARPGHFLSNVAQGGKVFKVEELLQEYPQLSAGKVVHQINNLALAMVRFLSKSIPHLADVGFDFGIDEKGHPYFIEMNGRDQRYSFKKGGESGIWKQTYEKPVAYARFLMDQQKGEQQ